MRHQRALLIWGRARKPPPARMSRGVEGRARQTAPASQRRSKPIVSAHARCGQNDTPWLTAPPSAYFTCSGAPPRACSIPGDTQHTLLSLLRTHSTPLQPFNRGGTWSKRLQLPGSTAIGWHWHRWRPRIHGCDPKAQSQAVADERRQTASRHGVGGAVHSGITGNRAS